MAGLVRDHLDMLILSVLAPTPAHGYAIVEELKRRSDGTFDLPEGSIYPALYRLEAARLLASEWHSASGRRRRVYRLTKRGRAVLATKRSEWDTFSRAVVAVLGGKPWPARA